MTDANSLGSTTEEARNKLIVSKGPNPDGLKPVFNENSSPSITAPDILFLYVNSTTTYLLSRATEVYSVFPDFSRAFDKVDHAIALHKASSL